MPYNGSGAAGCKKSLFVIHMKLFTLFVLTSTTDLIPGSSGAGWRGSGRGVWRGRGGGWRGRGGGWHGRGGGWRRRRGRGS